jgi:hypothetical protein
MITNLDAAGRMRHDAHYGDLAAAPGDVLAVWTSSSLTSDLIRVGEALRGLPAVANHVAIITHQDQKGRWIGIQGRPGGVGLVDCTYWLSDSRTRSNHAQPKPNDHNQLTVLLGSCAKSLGIQYDWVGIHRGRLHCPGPDRLVRGHRPVVAVALRA